jgi:hypothetical protein
VTLTDLGAGKIRLVVEPDMAWLHNPARVYPVMIDPTISAPTYGLPQDAMIDQANPDTVYNGASPIVGKNASGQRKDLLIKFEDVNKLPRQSAVIKATLRLYANSGTSGMPMQVQRITGAWSESSVTWNTAPATNATVVATPSAVVTRLEQY